MAHRFLVVPQWQGSGSSRAMRLADGAAAIAGDLPASATTRVDVRIEAGESMATGVRRASSIIAIRQQVAEAIAAIPGDETVIVIGGDCGADLAAVQHVLGSREPESVAVIWFDAHADLNTPETSPSGNFGGMVLRTLLGDGLGELVDPDASLAPSHVILAGPRDLDPGESAFLETSGATLLRPDEVTPERVVAAVEATGATSVYVHIDLDVLDPAEFESVGYPEPFGVSAAALAESVRAVRGRFPLAGAAVTGFAPASETDAADDLPVILRLLAALTANVETS